MRVLLGSSAAAEGATGEIDDAGLAALYETPPGPWLRVNMISTVDGAATGEGGKSGAINNQADKRVFDLLRSLADAVVVGAGTARTEGYRPLDRPLVLVSRSGEVPPLLADVEPGSVLLATVARAPGLATARAQLGQEHLLVLGETEVDLRALRATLGERGLVRLLGEGGPHLLHDLLTAGLVDELCATLVPRLVAGEHPRITAGPGLDIPLELRLLLEQDGTLIGRWFTQTG